MPTDAIDLARAVFHASLDEVRQWRITKAIVAVELKAGSGDKVGVRLSLAPYVPFRDRDGWPDFIPPTGGPGGGPWEGPLRWTLWTFVRDKATGVWHGAAVMEMWHDRVWTGAPILTDWREWFYRGEWGTELERNAPAPGDDVAFMATAGGLRKLKNWVTVRERTNVVLVRAAEHATYRFDEAAAPPPAAPSAPAAAEVTTPAPATVPAPPGAPIAAELDRELLQTVVDELRVNQAALATIQEQLDALSAREYVGEGRIGPFSGTVVLRPKK